MKPTNKMSIAAAAALLVSVAAFAEGGSGIGKDITARVYAYCDSVMTILNRASRSAQLADLESDLNGALSSYKQGLQEAAAVSMPAPGQRLPVVPIDTTVKRAVAHALETLKALEGGTTAPAGQSDLQIPVQATLKYLVGQYAFIADLERTVDRPIFNRREMLCQGCELAWASAEMRYQYFIAKEIGAAISREVTLHDSGHIRVEDFSKTSNYRGIRWIRETKIGEGFSDVMVSPVESAKAFLKIAEYTALHAADDLDGPVNGDGGSIFASSRCASSELRELAEQLKRHNAGDTRAYRNDQYATKFARDILLGALNKVVEGCR